MSSIVITKNLLLIKFIMLLQMSISINSWLRNIFIKSSLDAVCILFFFLILGLSFYMSLRANLDLAAGRFVLDMDERTAFNGVFKILNPKSAFDFFYAIFDGQDHRYGRIFWNVMALISVIPEKIWGETG